MQACCGCGKNSSILDNWAKGKIGQMIRAEVYWSGVPKGTVGKVIGYEWLGDGWDVMIEWELEGRDFRNELHADWFTQAEYEETLVEI